MIPMTPSSAIALPTRCGERPSPPVNRNGRRGWNPGGSGRAGSYTGVDRNTAQSELKVPAPNARKKCATNVMTTLNVKMRRNGSFCV